MRKRDHGVPGATDGTNWGGMATDQERGYVFVYSQNQGQIGWVERKKEGATQPAGMPRPGTM